jgi:hypothetical protein
VAARARDHGQQHPLLPRGSTLSPSRNQASTATASRPNRLARGGEQGRRAFVAQATGAAPFTSEWAGRLLMFDTVENSLLPLERWTARPLPVRRSKKVGDAELSVSVGSGGQLDVALGDFRASMAPGANGRFATHWLTVGGRLGHMRLRLVAYSPSRRTFTLLRGRIDEMQSNHPDRLADALGRGHHRRRERLAALRARTPGPTRADGDGTAEDMLGQLIEANHEHFAGLVTPPRASPGPARVTCPRSTSPATRSSAWSIVKPLTGRMSPRRSGP